MLPVDLAFAQFVNATTAAYTSNPPIYMSYRERTHIAAASLGRTQEIDRSVMVRVADNFAIMRDLPNGGERTGQAFPIIPYFDPLSNFTFGYYANLKRVDINLTRGAPIQFTLPGPDPKVNAVVPYVSFWSPSYAPDSTESRLHFTVGLTPRYNGYYPADLLEDPQTHLPAHIEIRYGTDEMIIDLDYAVIGGHWLLSHGSFTAQERVGPLSFEVVSDTMYDQFAFSTTAPDSRLAPKP